MSSGYAEARVLLDFTTRRVWSALTTVASIPRPSNSSSSSIVA
jgi:hypothetical protein